MITQYSIYMHKTPNNKVYIGLTSMEPRRRWLNGKGYRNQTLFFRAINKYGWENIEHLILFEGLNKEEAEKLEIELIGQYQSTNPKYGYNIQNGGFAAKHSEETKKKLSDLKKGVPFTDQHQLNLSIAGKGKKPSMGMLGKKMTEETKNKMSKSHKGKSQSPEHIRNAAEARKGFKHTDETIQKIRESKLGRPQSQERNQKQSDAMKAYWERRRTNDTASNT